MFTALLLAAGTAAAWQPPEPEPDPRLWNIQLEALRVGVGEAVVTDRYMHMPTNTHLGDWMDLRFLSAEVGHWKLRAGTSLLAGNVGLNLGDYEVSLSSVFPVRVGYTILQRPVRYSGGSSFQGMLPDVFVEAELYWLNGLFGDDGASVTGKAGICAEVDRYGLGAGAELAVFYNYESYYGLHTIVPSVSLYLRLVTNLGF